MNASPPDDRLLQAGLLALGAYGVGLGLFMVVAPGPFFEEIGPFGARNDHYIRDNATFTIALGAGALVAAARPRWRVPVLAITVLQFALHSVNHLVDIGEAEPGWIGVADFVALTVAALLLAALLRRGLQREVAS